MQSASAALAAAYPAYRRVLRLTLKDGTPLDSGQDGGAIVALVRKEAEARHGKGGAVPASGGVRPDGGQGGAVRLRNDWLTVEGGKVKNIDYENNLSS